jgi:hypothetical protein
VNWCLLAAPAASHHRRGGEYVSFAPGQARES